LDISEKKKIEVIKGRLESGGLRKNILE